MAGADRQGIESVLIDNRERLVRFLRAHGAGDAAEDLFQELWVRVTGRPTGPIAEPLAYLYRAANNLMLDWHRASRQTERRERAWAELAGAGDEASSGEPTAERALISREQLAEAEAALEALGSRVATCFRRFRLDRVPQRAIAAELGVSLGTVEGDLRKAYAALVALRRQFDDE